MATTVLPDTTTPVPGVCGVLSTAGVAVRKLTLAISFAVVQPLSEYALYV